MKTLHTILAIATALLWTSRAVAEDSEGGYTLEVAGTTYQVLSADAADGYRLLTPDGRVIGLPAADPAQPLTREALAANLATPPRPTTAPKPDRLAELTAKAAAMEAELAALKQRLTTAEGKLPAEKR